MDNTFKRIIRYFFSGTLFIVPLVATGYFIYVSFRWLDDLLNLPYTGLGFAIILFAITAFGYLTTNFAFRTFTGWFDRGINKIPLVKLLYGALKDLLDAFVGEKKKFNKPVLEAIGLMKTENISYLIVLDKNDKYIGVVSERDYTHKVILEGKQSANTKVSEIMTTNLANASLEDSTSKLMLLINNSKARYIPVFDGNNFKGIITIHDLMREAMADYERGKKDLDANELAFIKAHGA